MHVTKVITADGDLLIIDGLRDYNNPWPEIEMYGRRIKLLDIIQEITDPAELPEYLTDEDLRVRERASNRLDQLMEAKNG